MVRMFLLAIALGLPLCASAQVFRCADPATGKTLYTDQPCAGGRAVVPAPSAAESRAQGDRADAAQARALARDELALRRERLELEQDRANVRPQLPSESAACSEARKEAAFRAGSVGASDEQIRTARANAALACGQPAPEEIVVVPQPVSPYFRPHRPLRRDRDDFSRPQPYRRPPPNNPLGVAPYPIDVAPYPLH